MALDRIFCRSRSKKSNPKGSKFKQMPPDRTPAAPTTMTTGATTNSSGSNHNINGNDILANENSNPQQRHNSLSNGAHLRLVGDQQLIDAGLLDGAATMQKLPTIQFVREKFDAAVEDELSVLPGYRVLVNYKDTDDQGRVWCHVTCFLTKSQGFIPEAILSSEPVHCKKKMPRHSNQINQMLEQQKRHHSHHHASNNHIHDHDQREVCSITKDHHLANHHSHQHHSHHHHHHHDPSSLMHKMHHQYPSEKTCPSNGGSIRGFYPRDYPHAPRFESDMQPPNSLQGSSGCHTFNQKLFPDFKSHFNSPPAYHNLVPPSNPSHHLNSHHSSHHHHLHQQQHHQLSPPSHHHGSHHPILGSLPFDARASVNICRPFQVNYYDLYVAMYNFVAREENDLSVKPGESVQVLNKEDEDWYWVRRDDMADGFVPAAFLMPRAKVESYLNKGNSTVTCKSTNHNDSHTYINHMPDKESLATDQQSSSLQQM